MITATILVVAALTIIIFALSIIAFSSLIKAEKAEIDAGKRDSEILDADKESKSKKNKIFSIISNGISFVIMGVLLSAAVTSIIYRVNGEQFTVNDHTALVIVSDSMDGFYNDEYKAELIANREDAEKQQFKIGDILDFYTVNADDDLVLFDVYAYKNNVGQLITHRYIGNTATGSYIFRGDNTGGRDSYVERNQIVYHYLDKKVERLGLFLMFSKSGFGLYSLLSVISVYAVAEVYGGIYNKAMKKRYMEITGQGFEVIIDEK